MVREVLVGDTTYLKWSRPVGLAVVIVGDSGIGGNLDYSDVAVNSCFYPSKFLGIYLALLLENGHG